MLSEQFRISSRRLNLLFPSERPFAALRTAAQYEPFTRYLGFAPSSTVDAFRYRLKDTHRLWQAGERFTFDAWDSEGQFFVGRVRLSRAGGGAWRLGYFVIPRLWRQGYGAEMAAAAVKAAFEVLGAAELSATISANNAASAGLARRIGLLPQDPGAHRGPAPGLIRFGTSREDWMAGQSETEPCPDRPRKTSIPGSVLASPC